MAQFTEPLNIAIVGAGYWGLRCIHTVYESFPGSQIQVVDPDKSRLDEILERFPNSEGFAEVSEILESHRPEMAIVATPARFHGPTALQLLEAGVSVLVEKPFALNEHELSVAVDYERKGLTVSAGYLYAHNPLIVAAKRIQKEGRFGKVLFLESLRESFGAFRKDVNVVRDLMVHDISICIELTGMRKAKVESVQERFPLPTGYSAEIEVELRTAEGIGIKLRSSNMRPEKIRRTTVFFERAIIVLDEQNALAPFRVFETPAGLAPQARHLWKEVEYPELMELDALGFEVDTPRKTLSNSITAFVREVRFGERNKTGIQFAKRVHEIAETIEFSLGIPVD